MLKFALVFPVLDASVLRTIITEEDMRDSLRAYHSNYEHYIRSSSRPSQQNALTTMLTMMQSLTGKHHSYLGPNPEPEFESEPGSEPEPTPEDHMSQSEGDDMRAIQIIDAHLHTDSNGTFIPDNFHTSVEMLTAMIMFKAGKTDVIYNELEHTVDYHHLEYFVYKYANYGCYCFHDLSSNTFTHHTLGGSVVDETDEVCMKWYKCDKCTRLDPSFNSNGDTCDENSFYRCSGSIVNSDESGQWEEIDRYVECTDPEGSCARAKCECDLFLVNEMAERFKYADEASDPFYSSQFSNYPIHDDDKCTKHEQLGGPKTCCGYYQNANIMPYYTQHRQCCQTSRLTELGDDGYQIYDPVEKKCCTYGNSQETITSLVPIDWMGTCDED